MNRFAVLAPSRTRHLLITGAVLLATALVAATDAGAQTASSATLEERLLFGLQARRPSETAFVRAVVDTVGRGELPRRIVDRTFFYARKRVPKQGGKFLRRPIIYFQPVLLAQTERLGIEIRPNP